MSAPGMSAQRNILKLLGQGLLVVTILIGYQNCGDPFAASSNLGSSLIDSLENRRRLEAPGLYLSNGTSGADVAADSTLKALRQYILRIGSSKYDSAAIVWSIDSALNTANCALGEMSDPLYRSCTCQKDGQVKINVLAVFLDGSQETLSVTKTVVPADSDPTDVDDTVIIFNIAAGTGTNPWNTAANPIKVNLGQTVRFINRDTANHQLRSPGGINCAQQGAPMTTNQFYDCRITGARTAALTDLYDLIAGPSAVVYVQVEDGPGLYANATKGRCNQCHGNLATSTKRNRSAQQIRASITGNSGGVMGSIVLNDDEIAAIAYSLSH